MLLSQENKGKRSLSSVNKMIDNTQMPFVVPRSDFNSQKNEFLVWTRISKMQKKMNQKNSTVLTTATLFNLYRISLVTENSLQN